MHEVVMSLSGLQTVLHSPLVGSLDLRMQGLRSFISDSNWLCQMNSAQFVRIWLTSPFERRKSKKTARIRSKHSHVWYCNNLLSSCAPMQRLAKQVLVIISVLNPHRTPVFGCLLAAIFRVVNLPIILVTSQLSNVGLSSVTFNMTSMLMLIRQNTEHPGWRPLNEYTWLWYSI